MASREEVRKFLMGCSGQELADFLMTRHTAAANLRSDLFELLDKWVEAAAEARLAAEVNAIRQELKHASTLPFPEKVKETPPQPEAAATSPPLDHADHGGRNLNAVGRKHSRQFFQR